MYKRQHQACPRFALEELPITGAYFSDRSQEIGMVEVMIAADSGLVGKTVIEAALRTRFHLTLVGLRRGQKAIEGGHLSEPLKVGDTLLLIGSWKDIDRLPVSYTHLVRLLYRYYFSKLELEGFRLRPDGSRKNPCLIVAMPVARCFRSLRNDRDCEGFSRQSLSNYG